jgi:hypothetical protein
MDVITDEEIKKKAKSFDWGYKPVTEYEIWTFIQGAKWMREKLTSTSDEIEKPL